MMTTSLDPVLVFIIFVALTFDFLNGFHDAANSIATVVSTRVLSPQKAVLWAAFFNFVAAFVLGTHVAKTIGSGIPAESAFVTAFVVGAGSSFVAAGIAVLITPRVRVSPAVA